MSDEHGLKAESNGEEDVSTVMLVEVTDEIGGKFMLDLEMTQAEFDAWMTRLRKLGPCRVSISTTA